MSNVIETFNSIKIFQDTGFNTSFNILWLIFTITWIFSVLLKNSSLVDLIWGFSNAIQVILFYYYGNNTEKTSTASISVEHKEKINLILMIIVSIHGLKLTGYLCLRNLGHGEDKRYKNFRKIFTNNYWWISYFQVFILQLVLNMVISSHLRFFMREKITSSNIFIAIFGAIIAFAGSDLETIADLQLLMFKAKLTNKGKLLTKGVWSLCRHPNYFGEILFWWGTYFFNLSKGQYWCLYSPVLFTFIIIFVSGISLTEKGMSKNTDYNEEYKRYIQKTKKLIPFIW